MDPFDSRSCIRAKYIRGRGMSRRAGGRATVSEVTRSHLDSDSRTRMAATRPIIMSATNYVSEDEEVKSSIHKNQFILSNLVFHTCFYRDNC